MSSNTINEDLRSIKTKKALFDAMFSLLRKTSFKKLTTKGICEEAFISRATFYAHFVDKYDLLKHWIAELWPPNIFSNSSYEQIEKAVNCHINENMSVLKNIVYDADNETMGILYEFIIASMNLSVKKDDGKELYQKNIVLTNFLGSGIVSYLLWQVNNKFPPDVPPMNRHLYEMIHAFQEWQSK